MKKNSNIAHYSIFICVLLTFQISQQTSFMNFSNNNEVPKNMNITPSTKSESFNMKDPSVSVPKLKRFVKAFYEQKFEPQYIDSLDEKKKIIASPTLRKAETIASQDDTFTEGLSQEPILYTTVVKPKPISIKHSGGYDLLKTAKSHPKTEYEKLEKKVHLNERVNILPGQFSIPVRVSGNGVQKDPTKKFYQNPDNMIGLNKGKAYRHTNINELDDEESSRFFKDTFTQQAAADYALIHKGFEHTHEKLSEKEVANEIKSLVEARKTIKTEAKDLLIKLRNRVKKINNINTINEKLNDLLDIYSKYDTEEEKNVDILLKDLKQKISK